MEKLIIIGIICFILGFISGAFVFKKRKEDSLFYNLLIDFRKTIEDYKNQNTINTKEIQNAIKDASHLGRILTTNQNLKGQFGEECLETIIKTCYPSCGLNYIKQYETENEDGKKIKPDYLIKLPNDKSVLIDCKLNLQKYLEYKEHPQDENKKADFIKDINNTINNLAQKKYETAVNTFQPDFILMYIPLEPVLTTIYTDKDFLGTIKLAGEKNIIIAGNSSILTILRLVKLLWAQNSSEKNIEEIINTAKSIYEYIAQHTQNLFEIKKQMEKNYENFNKEYEKMASNKLFKITENLRNLGIQTKSQKIGKKLNEVKINENFLNGGV